MEYDMNLAKICKPGELFLRLYRWEPYCISLGANQNFDSINIEKAKADNIDIIKRPTGGRAILHSEELTYSVVTTTKDQTSTHKFYNEINKAIRKGLEFFNKKLVAIELESEQADFPKIYREGKGNVCFATTAKSEIKFNCKKLVGSAQRKLGNNLLQHGSILCGGYHKKIVEYLNLTDDESRKIYSNMNNVTVDLRTILDIDIDYYKLRESIKKGFEKHFNNSFDEISINYGEKEFVKDFQ